MRHQTDRRAVRRINVVGTSGAGKSTLARAIADRLAIPCIELDALQWEANWTEAEPDVFRERLRTATAGDAWIVDGNYSHLARDIVWPRVDAVVWLDLPFRLVLWQVVTRTLDRLVRRRELWNGNRESLRMLFSRDSIVYWAISTYAPRRRAFEAAMRDPANVDIRFVRLRSRGAVRRYLAELD